MAGWRAIWSSPAIGWVRRELRPRRFGAIEQVKLDRPQDGITIEGIAYGRIEASIRPPAGATMRGREHGAVGGPQPRNPPQVLEALYSQGQPPRFSIPHGLLQLGKLTAAGAIEEVPRRDPKRTDGRLLWRTRSPPLRPSGNRTRPKPSGIAKPAPHRQSPRRRAEKRNKLPAARAISTRSRRSAHTTAPAQREQ